MNRQIDIFILKLKLTLNYLASVFLSTLLPSSSPVPRRHHQAGAGPLWLQQVQRHRPHQQRVQPLQKAAVAREAGHVPRCLTHAEADTLITQVIVELQKCGEVCDTNICKRMLQALPPLTRSRISFYPVSKDFKYKSQSVISSGTWAVSSFDSIDSCLPWQSACSWCRSLSWQYWCCCCYHCYRCCCYSGCCCCCWRCWLHSSQRWLGIGRAQQTQWRIAVKRNNNKKKKAMSSNLIRWNTLFIWLTRN